jgi:hypothetical protein
MPTITDLEKESTGLKVGSFLLNAVDLLGMTEQHIMAWVFIASSLLQSASQPQYHPDQHQSAMHI